MFYYKKGPLFCIKTMPKNIYRKNSNRASGSSNAISVLFDKFPASYPFGVFLTDPVSTSNNVVAPATMEEWFFRTFLVIIIRHDRNTDKRSDGRRRAALQREQYVRRGVDNRPMYDAIGFGGYCHIFRVLQEKGTRLVVVMVEKRFR